MKQNYNYIKWFSSYEKQGSPDKNTLLVLMSLIGTDSYQTNLRYLKAIVREGWFFSLRFAWESHDQRQGLNFSSREECYGEGIVSELN